MIEVELGFVYDIIFTKAAIAHRPVGYVFRLIGSACIPAAFLAFFFADKRRFTRLDVAITYALLGGAAVLDFAALVMLLCSDWARVFIADKQLFKECSACINYSLSRWRRRRWSEKVSQMSLIGYCLDEPVGAWVQKWVASRPVSWLADKVGVKEVFRRDALREPQEGDAGDEEVHIRQVEGGGERDERGRRTREHK